MAATSPASRTETSANPSASGQTVTFTATVSTTGTLAPTGNVNFYDGVTLLGSTAITGSKTATYSTSSLAVGSHNITATYVGDINYVTSTSTALAQVEQAAATALLLHSVMSCLKNFREQSR